MRRRRINLESTSPPGEHRKTAPIAISLKHVIDYVSHTIHEMIMIALITLVCRLDAMSAIADGNWVKCHHQIGVITGRSGSQGFRIRTGLS